jgi:hypothetical protein
MKRELCKPMHSFKRLSPYNGPHIPEWVREYGEELEDNPAPDHEPGQWQWDDGSGTYQCELELCDLDSDTIDPAGYVAIVPLGIGERCWIRCVLEEKFAADAKAFSSRIFESFVQAKAVLDVALAFQDSRNSSSKPLERSPQKHYANR